MIEECPHNDLRHARTNTEFWDGDTDEVWRCLDCEAWLKLRRVDAAET